MNQYNTTLTVRNGFLEKGREIFVYSSRDGSINDSPVSSWKC